MAEVNRPGTSSINPFEKFHQEVSELSKQQPTSKLGKILKKIVDLTRSKEKIIQRNVEVAAKIHDLATQADVILSRSDVILSRYSSAPSSPAEAGKKDASAELPQSETPREAGLPDDTVSESFEGTRKLSVLKREEWETFNRDMNILFKKIFPHLDATVFGQKLDEKVFGTKHGMKKMMPESIQHYFHPTLKELREKERLDPSLSEDFEHQTDISIAKGKLADTLGHGIKANKGATGTLIIKDIDGKPVGVHKVSEQYVPIGTRMQNRFKSICGQLSCLSDKKLAQPLSERAAFLLSSQLGFNLAPASKEAVIHGREGVFQIFVSHEKGQGISADVRQAQRAIEGHKAEMSTVRINKRKGKRSEIIPTNKYVEFKDVIGQVDGKKEFSLNEQTTFQKFAIFDYLIGNLDRHEENWFVTVQGLKDGNGKELVRDGYQELEITHIKAIDNANAFPRKMPAKGSVAARNQYKWKKRNIAEQPFTDEAKSFVLKNLGSKKIDDFIANLEKEMPGFLDDEMKGLLKQRAAVIYALVSKPGKSPKELAEYSTSEDMGRFLYQSLVEKTGKKNDRRHN